MHNLLNSLLIYLPWNISETDVLAGFRLSKVKYFLKEKIIHSILFFENYSFQKWEAAHHKGKHKIISSQIHLQLWVTLDMEN